MLSRRLLLVAFTVSSIAACSDGTIDDPGATSPASDDGGLVADGSADVSGETPSTIIDGCTGLADGTYCGSKASAATSALVTCAGGVTTKTETCKDGCYVRSPDGHDDVCGSDSVDPCFNDPDGVYCGGEIGGDAKTLYTCQGKRTAKSNTCPSGCWDNPDTKANDACLGDSVEPCFNDGDGAYCGDSIGGPAGKVYHCKDHKTASIDDCGGPGCLHEPDGVADICNGELLCSHVQWWNSALTYGPYMSYGWWDTDLAVSHDTPVQLRHASRLDKHGVYGWGYMPEFTDLVTGKRFRFLHLRPASQFATQDGKIYPAGYIVGMSGGDTNDTGYPTYSTGAHLCVQTLDAYRDCFPTGKDACK